LQDADGDGDEHGTGGEGALVGADDDMVAGRAIDFLHHGVQRDWHARAEPLHHATEAVAHRPVAAVHHLAHRVPRGDLIGVGGVDDGEDVGVGGEVGAVGVEQRQHVAVLV